MPRELRVFETVEETWRALRLFLQDYFKNSNKHIIGISGGSCLEMLSHIMTEQDDWWKPNKCTFFVCDERLVDSTESASNHGEFLRITSSKEVRGIWPKCEMYKNNGKQCASDYGKQIEDELTDSAMVDLVILGVGCDGHTASIFPGDRQIEAKKEVFAYVKNAPKLPPQRISLTPGFLNERVKIVLFFCTGKEKRLIIQNIFQNDGCKAMQYPASKIFGAQQCIWFVDDKAHK